MRNKPMMDTAELSDFQCDALAAACSALGSDDSALDSSGEKWGVVLNERRREAGRGSGVV